MEQLHSLPVRYLKGVGPKKAGVLAASGVNTIEDLLYYFPRRYEDRTSLATIFSLREGQAQTIKARVLSAGRRSSWQRRAFSIIEAAVTDGTAPLFCVWFNQPYLLNYLKPGASLILFGKVERYNQRLQMTNPEFELIENGADESLSLGRLVPVYPLPAGFTQRTLRRLVKEALDKYLGKTADFLPFDIRSRHNLFNLAQALLHIHFPESPEAQKQAYNRLSFEEFLLFQLPLALRKLKKKEEKGLVQRIDGRLAQDFIKSLPFKLTASQNKVLEEIKSDMASLQVMQRLLQGDVGSGKTVVAVIASLIAVDGGYQAALLVPTEILAKQHIEKLDSLGVKRLIKDSLASTTSDRKMVSAASERRVVSVLLTSGISKKEKDKIYKEIAEGKVDIVIGTHALLEEGVRFKGLGLVVIDEQHKFGVGQRALLPKKGPNPDLLIMTATPIPRTLAITLYGDLDISVINELPPGRVPVRTLHFSQENKTEAYTLIKNELSKGRQAYIIYPVIEESYALDIAGAKKMYAELKKGEFKDFKVGLIHGKLKQEEQDTLMHKFKEKSIDMLVSTTVLEVGIDIANATCMMIEHAERFGLSQLHQLRGRVGRGAEQSFCILVTGVQSEAASQRVEAMLRYSDGFKVAEEDLKIRGPGEFFGRKQHGLAELKIGNPLTQMQLLKHAREEALRLVAADPELNERQHTLLRGKLLERFPEYRNGLNL